MSTLVETGRQPAEAVEVSNSRASIAFEAVSKRFGQVIANDVISCEVQSGGIHAFLGENGAGKSTLMKILCGFYQPDDGVIRLSGAPVSLRSPEHARKMGIGMVHQQFTLVPSMTVLENIVLGDPRTSFVLSWKETKARVKALAENCGIDLDLSSPVWRLSVADRQKIEILKLLWRDARILVLDEPTSQLAPFEAEDILSTMQRLARDGKIVILISHHLEEILRFASRITVLRRGQHIATVNTKDVSAEDIAQMMVDSIVTPAPLEKREIASEPLLALKDVGLRGTQTHRSLQSISFDIFAGQVLGIAGVVGSGQEEIANILAGQLVPHSGSLTINGKSTPWHTMRNPKHAAAYVPSDSKKGTVSTLSVMDNSALRDIHRRESMWGPFLNKKFIDETARERIKAFDVRPANSQVPSGSLSGGNLQRLIIARELGNDSDLLIAVNPTAGLDLNMSQRIQHELKNYAVKGKAVVLISPDLQELLSTCDRVLVVCAGKVIGIEDSSQLNAESLGLLVGGMRIDLARELLHYLQDSSVTFDPKLKPVVRELLTSVSSWQRRLAARIALRVFDNHDLPLIHSQLKKERNEECVAWLRLLLAKLGGKEHFERLAKDFERSSNTYIEIYKSILCCTDLSTLAKILTNRDAAKREDWEELLANLVLAQLRFNELVMDDTALSASPASFKL